MFIFVSGVVGFLYSFSMFLFVSGVVVAFCFVQFFDVHICKWCCCGIFVQEFTES